MVLGVILTTEAAARKGDVKKRKIFAVIGGVLVTTFFSLLLSIFRNKAQGYPYRYVSLIFIYNKLITSIILGSMMLLRCLSPNNIMLCV